MFSVKITDDDVTAPILAAVRDGKKQGEAAAAGGVHRVSLVRALMRGRRNPESEYGLFAQAYAKAQEIGLQANLKRFAVKLESMNR